MSTDDVGARRSLTPIEAFAAITYDRVLIIDETSGRMYVKQSDRDEYHWYSVNRHGAFCGQWFWDRMKSKDVVKAKLRSEHCHNQAHEQITDLKSRIQQGLRE